MAATSTDRGSTRARRRVVGMLVGLGAGWSPVVASTKPLLEVWKSPTCGCCKDWVAHVEANGFDVRVHDVGNTAMRGRLGMPAKLGSCHTAKLGPYAIEGHVPAREVHRLLTEKPEAVGLAVPGMPIGSPGMDGPQYGPRKDAYDVLLVRKDGSTTPFQTYR